MTWLANKFSEFFPCGDVGDARIFSVFMLVALFVNVLAFRNPAYRKDFHNWFTLKDPFGSGLWRRHYWVYMVTLASGLMFFFAGRQFQAICAS